jgi:hypothetical protein
MTFLDAMLGARLVSAEDKILALLEHIGDARKLSYHEDLPGPVCELKDGRVIAFDSWEAWDVLCERKWVEVDEEQTRAAVTWAGEKALRKWHKKGGRAG